MFALDDIVEYKVYIHGSKESAYESAREAGLTDEEIYKYELTYIGYEVEGKITVNRTTGQVSETWR